MDTAAAEYQARLSAEENFFANCGTVHDLPDIFHYWSDTYIRPKLAAIGFTGAKEVHTDPLRALCKKRSPRTARFLSIGAGNCDLEVELAVTLKGEGHSNFVIDCLDLNPAMLQRGSDAAESLGVSRHIAGVQADFNNWQPGFEYDGVIAIHSLHHVMNLEGLFSQIKASLAPDGCFAISDIIGRNGHLRWPEATPFIHQFWRKLPPSYRFNRQLKRYEALFEDWDCSVDGFEGIRAQDILGLLIENFHFDRFVAFGNIIDPFVDRGFGHNFDASAAWDRAFIDEVHQCDETLMREGVIKPTHVFAVLRKAGDVPTVFLENLSPSFCVRHTDRAMESTGADEGVPQNYYAWDSWPHSPQRELQRVCEILGGVEIDRRDSARGMLQLTGEIEKRTEWALRLNQEVQERTEWAQRLDREFTERTEWALRLDAELAQQTQSVRDLTQQLAERPGAVDHMFEAVRSRLRAAWGQRKSTSGRR